MTGPATPKTAAAIIQLLRILPALDFDQGLTAEISAGGYAASDHTSFLCRPAPAFRLQSSYSEYRQYTWHTNRDTFDKIIFAPGLRIAGK